LSIIDKKAWRYSTDIKDIVDAPRELVDCYFLQPFHLLDLSQISDDEIKNHAWASILEFALKHIYERDILPWVKKMIPNMRYIIGEGGEKYIEIVLEYFMEQGELSSEKDYISLINKEISSKIGEKLMSYFDKVKSEIKQEGIQQG